MFLLQPFDITQLEITGFKSKSKKKVAFLAPNGPLVEQHVGSLSKYLPYPAYKVNCLQCSCFTISWAKIDPILCCVQSSDVLSN